MASLFVAAACDTPVGSADSDAALVDSALDQSPTLPVSDGTVTGSADAPIELDVPDALVDGQLSLDATDANQVGQFT